MQRERTLEVDMEQLRNLGDERQTGFCVYCGSTTETRDHVPSKVFLDEPYPTNLPVVPACRSCNEGFSLDEEFVACLVACALAGSASARDVRSEKISRILQTKPALASRIDKAREENLFGDVAFRVESDRVRNVVLKLARGHAAFELNEPQFDSPRTLTVVPMPSMTRENRENFERPPTASIWPEVGSRAMQRAIQTSHGSSRWIVVQPGRYRYLTAVSNGAVVRMVLSEYLGGEVTWP